MSHDSDKSNKNHDIKTREESINDVIQIYTILCE